VNRIILLALLAGAFWLWRQNKLRGATVMSVSEAARVLDIPLDSDAAEINAAHKRLISRVHPDTGGTAELASRVNQARDVMLKHRQS
jgi:hypothetical protein